MLRQTCRAPELVRAIYETEVYVGLVEIFSESAQKKVLPACSSALPKIFGWKTSAIILKHQTTANHQPHCNYGFFEDRQTEALRLFRSDCPVL